MSSPIGVTLIANGFQPHYVYDLTNALAEDGRTEVCLIGSDIYEPLKFVPGVRFLNLRGSHEERASFISKLFRKAAYYFKLARYSLTSGTKVFHVLWLSPNQFVDGVLFVLIFRACGKKVVYTAHNVLPHEKTGRWTRGLFLMIYKIVDVVIVHTEAIKKRLVLEFNINENKIFIVRHGVYLSKNDPEIGRGDSRANLGLSLQDKVVLFFGRVTPYKGLHLLVGAVERCIACGIDLKLLIAGKVYHDEYMRRIEKQTDAPLLRDHVTTRLGYMEDHEVEIFFKAADVVVLPYEEGSQSGVLFLSYSYGRPVIASDIGSFPEDIQIGKTGYIFRSGDARDLADKLTHFFIEMSGQGGSLERAIQEFASQRYSWKSSAETLAGIYDQILDKR